MRRLLVPIVVLSAAATALAHVAPSVDDNNRYLKLAPLGDRVRLAYTVFFGEIPGAAMRRDIDANHDGTIDDAESQAFGEKLAKEVGDGLEVTVDERAQRVTWGQVVVGMGTPATAAGTFSVDLIASLCLPTVRGKHHVTLRDRFRVPRPGETEVLVEATPGVTIDRARVGTADDPSYDYKFVGPGGVLSDEGLDLRFTAGDKAAVTPDTICQGGSQAAQRPPVGLVLGAAAVLAFLLAGAVVLVQRRRRR